MSSPPEIGRPLAVAAPVVEMEEVSLRLLRALLWLYIALWIFEGALRKWILPGLANPLLVVRDPVLLLIYTVALAKGIFPRNAFVFCITVLGGIAFATSFVATDTPLLVELYGLRAGYLHLPLMFVIAELFNFEDVKRVGKCILLMSIPMALLVLLQFRAHDTSWLNVGAGGSGTMIESAFGHIRPSGTFSFTNGLSGFTAMTASFFLYHLLEKGVYPRLLWLAVCPVLIILIILSGSRLAVGTLALIVSTVLLISVLQPRYASSAVKLVVLAGIAIMVLGSFTIFKEGLNVFSYRFGTATNVQTGFVSRFFRSFTEPFTLLKDTTIGGRGLGLGTNVAAGLISGKRSFLIAEGEPARVLLESGPIVGIAYLMLRASIAIYLGYISFGSLRRDGRTLPLLLFTGCFNDILQGQFSQPTELGYATIAGGLCLAANQHLRAAAPAAKVVARPAATPPSISRQQPAPAAPAVEQPVIKQPAPGRGRGRSAYAERLHQPDQE